MGSARICGRQYRLKRLMGLAGLSLVCVVEFLSSGTNRCSWAGRQEGRDGYDTIDWISRQPWSNGSIAMMGNSWLGRSQWYIAAERPPALKCIAPLEGSGDLYREIHVRGGLACEPFLEWMMHGFHGKRLSLLSCLVLIPSCRKRTTGRSSSYVEKTSAHK